MTNIEEKHIHLSYSESVFRILKQRKNRLMKKLGYDKLTWNDFFKIRGLCGGLK